MDYILHIFGYEVDLDRLEDKSRYGLNYFKSKFQTEYFCNCQDLVILEKEILEETGVDISFGYFKDKEFVKLFTSCCGYDAIIERRYKGAIQ